MWRRFLEGFRVPDPAAPSPVPEPRWLVVACYIGFPLAALLIALIGLRVTSLGQLSAAPLVNYDDGDALLILPMIRDAVEQGTHWHNPRLGAPGEFQLYDFPVIDHLHFAGVLLVGKVSGSWVAAYNWYYVLTYPLTVLTTLLVLRYFGFSLPAAGVSGLLYAFLHYHATRSQVHYFLSAYWVIPLSMYVVLQTCRGEPPLTEMRDGRLCWVLWRKQTLAALVIMVMTALAGAYYAFFTCALLAFACIYGSVAAWSWKPAAAGGMLLAVVFATGVAAHEPAIRFQSANGQNRSPTRRQAIEAELFGLKLADMLLPRDNHQCPKFADFAKRYQKDRPLPSENVMAPLGIVIATGLLGVGVAFLMPNARRWPVGPLGALIVFALLLATIGGLGAIFNFVVSPQIRAYSRISVFIAFFGLFAAMWALDRGLSPWPRARWIVLLALAPFAIVDQTPRPWFRRDMIETRERNAARFASDRAFYQQVDANAGSGMVFALPHIPYPENVPRHGMTSAYAFATAYLHTDTARWSFGAMRERETDAWLISVFHEPTPRMVERLRERGFVAICIDVKGYTDDERKALFESLTALCGPPVARQEDGSRVLFDLRPRGAAGGR